MGGGRVGMTEPKAGKRKKMGEAGKGQRDLCTFPPRVPAPRTAQVASLTSVHCLEQNCSLAIPPPPPAVTLDKLAHICDRWERPLPPFMRITGNKVQKPPCGPPGPP